MPLHPFKCPACSGSGPFGIHAEVIATVRQPDDVNYEVDMDNSYPDWREVSEMFCIGCGYHSTVAAFRVEPPMTATEATIVDWEHATGVGGLA